jgi:gas vesicle protein
MFKVKSNHSFVDLFEGIIIGGSLIAAATFLFGTKKGKEWQKKLVQQYKKLGHVSHDIREQFEKVLKTHLAKQIKRAVKTQSKKVVKMVKRKAKAAKKKAHRKAA